MSSVRDAASPLHQTTSGPPPPTGEEKTRSTGQTLYQLTFVNPAANRESNPALNPERGLQAVHGAAHCVRSFAGLAFHIHPGVQMANTLVEPLRPVGQARQHAG